MASAVVPLDRALLMYCTMFVICTFQSCVCLLTVVVVDEFDWPINCCVTVLLDEYHCHQHVLVPALSHHQDVLLALLLPSLRVLWVLVTRSQRDQFRRLTTSSSSSSSRLITRMQWSFRERLKQCWDRRSHHRPVQRRPPLNCAPSHAGLSLSLSVCLHHTLVLYTVYGPRSSSGLWRAVLHCTMYKRRMMKNQKHWGSSNLCQAFLCCIPDCP